MVIGLINDTTTQEGQKHLAIAMVVWCNAKDDITKGELEIRNLHWKPIRALPNDLAEFEAWSKTFLQYLVRHLDFVLNAYR
jgi:predicted NUDIX family phosphoesterase